MMALGMFVIGKLTQVARPAILVVVPSQGRGTVIVDAGVGTASDVTIAMELGVDGVLLNTGIASAKDPVRMAHAMRCALEAGYLACRAGRIPKKLYATASSPSSTISRAGEVFTCLGGIGLLIARCNLSSISR